MEFKIQDWMVFGAHVQLLNVLSLWIQKNCIFFFYRYKPRVYVNTIYIKRNQLNLTPWPTFDVLLRNIYAKQTIFLFIYA